MSPDPKSEAGDHRDATGMNRVQRAIAVEKLLPAGAIAFELRGAGSPESLLPLERECVARAVEKRIREFAAGRACARAAMAELGIEPAPLLSGQDRMPVWPAGIVGSITHTHGYCLAVVALQSQFASIGVDAERLGRLGPQLWRLTLREEERSKLQHMQPAASGRTATVIFSAKEAFYKYQYVLTRRWLGFHDVAVDVAADGFDVQVIDASHPLRTMSISYVGRYRVDDDLVISAIASSSVSDNGAA